MPDDEDIPATVTGTFQVPETIRLYRLTPVARDLAQPARQSAIVAAETEADARAFAVASDPFGLDWKNQSLFTCDYLDTTERHVVGDVWFKSIAPPAPPRRRSSRKKDDQGTS